MILLLQFPEGLKQKALEYAEKYEQDGHEIYLSSAPCFGACDLALEEAKAVNADKIIHFGHSKFINSTLPIKVEYVEFPIDIDLKILQNSLEYLKDYRKIALATTIQHIHQLEKIKEFFNSKGKIILTQKGNKTSYEGQILGCDPNAITRVEKDSDAVLFIGDGLFHALAIKIEKPVFVLNPYSGGIRKINGEIEKLKKKRKGMLAGAYVSKTFGILVSTKPGQFNLSSAKIIKKKLREKGKEAHILIANNFDSYSLENFMAFDCYITTACPRISDDSGQFEKPILDLELFEELIKML
ncbi:MAG: diphthamide biosynthesis enzyme Dph2 [Candidatus Micrarchaeia archaeon]